MNSLIVILLLVVAAVGTMSPLLFGKGIASLMAIIAALVSILVLATGGTFPQF